MFIIPCPPLLVFLYSKEEDLLPNPFSVTDKRNSSLEESISSLSLFIPYFSYHFFLVN